MPPAGPAGGCAAVAAATPAPHEEAPARHWTCSRFAHLPQRDVAAHPAWRALGDEAAALFDALARPGRLVAEVERMRAWQVEAEAIAATDPARARALRERAARGCLGHPRR